MITQLSKLSVIVGLSFWSVAQAQEFDFGNPKLDEAPKKEVKADVPIGSYGGLNFGVLFDARYMKVGSNAPGTVIHVNELNVTGNIGDNISILAEQLLPTSILSGVEDQIGDDHGFVYGIFSNIPFLPAGTAFKIGRFRFKWGVDAVLDAPSNPIYPLTRKNLGFISDRGLELSGFVGPIDYTLGLADGPNYIEESLRDPLGNEVGVANRSVPNNSLPVIARLSSKVSNSKFGLSYFDGRSFAYSNFSGYMPNTPRRARHPGGMADKSKLVYRQHAAIDYSAKFGKFDVAAEYSQGLDHDTMANYRTKGYFARSDYAISPQKLIVQLQYDQYSDGVPNVKDERSISAGLQLFIHDQAFLRFGYMYNHLGLTSSDNAGLIEDIAFTQFYLPL